MAAHAGFGARVRRERDFRDMIERLQRAACGQCGRMADGKRLRVVRVAHMEVCEDCLADALLIACDGSGLEAEDAIGAAEGRL